MQKLVIHFFSTDDNAHLDRAVLFEDNLKSERITRMEWLAYSCDFNVNENLWETISLTVCTNFSLPATITELQTTLQQY